MLPHTLQRRDFLAVGAAVIDFGKIPTRKAGKAFFRLLRPPRLGAGQGRRAGIANFSPFLLAPEPHWGYNRATVGSGPG